MIALPVAAHSRTNKDSPGMMSGDEEWPSLGGPQAPAATTTEGDDWELVVSENGAGQGEASNTGIEEVMMPNPQPLVRKNSVSAPDLRVLDEDEDEDDDATGISSSAAMMSNLASLAESGTVVVAAGPWGKKNKVSFKDAILSKSKHVQAAAPSPAAEKPPMKNRFKSRYVVTQIKRCAKSTGDLLSLVENEEDEPMGDSDAMEYYSRKAHGAHGRSNGLKQRPDEAKRKEMIVQKKNMQRQKQQKK